MKTKVAIFSLKGKDDIWWEDMRNVKEIREKELPWRRFENYFREQYLPERSYDNKIK